MQFQTVSLLLAPFVFLAGSPAPIGPAVEPTPSPQQQHDPIDPVLVPPNVLVILVDDLGLDQLLVYDDVNRYTCPYPYAFTPNIDYLASIGVRFRQARVTPLCSPTRAELQSGRYGRRTGCGTLVAQSYDSTTFCELNRSNALQYTMLGNVLDPFGYTSAMFGKLHLQLEQCDTCPGSFGIGTGDSYALDVLGFDRFVGSPRNLNSDPDTGIHPCDPGGQWRGHSFTHYYQVTALPGQPPVRELVCGCPGGCPTTTNQCIELACPGSTSDCVTCPWQDCYDGMYATRKQRLAVESWTQSANEPFFALWCVNDIHAPLEWPPAYDPAFPTVEGHFQGSEPLDDPLHDNRRLRAKLEYFDSSLGMLLQSIDLERTVVVLLGDNGTQPQGVTAIENDEVAYPPGHPLYPYDPSPCAPSIPAYSMAPYQAGHLKGTPYEGGVRVPLIVAGKGVVPGTSAPRVSDALVDAVDLQETLRQIAQGTSYVAPQTCVQSAVSGCTDSVSFACVLKNTCTPATHARQFSHAGLFWPNSFPATPIITSGQEAREYYMRRGTTGRLWKIVRKYEGLAPNSCYRDEFYEVVTDPLEVMNLGTTHPQYAATKAEFDARFPPFFNPCP